MRKFLRNSSLKFGVLILLIVVFVSGSALPVMADTTTTTTTASPALHIVQGKVTAISASSFTIQNAANTSNIIDVGPDTKYFMVPMGRAAGYAINQRLRERFQDRNQQSPAEAMKDLHIPKNWRDNLGWLATFGNTGKFTDMAGGDRVIARVTTDNLAVQVLIIKAPAIRVASGTVTISGDTLSILTTQGTTIGPLTWDTNTIFIIKGTISVPSGQFATVTYNANTNTATMVNFTVKENKHNITSTPSTSES